MFKSLINEFKFFYLFSCIDESNNYLYQRARNVEKNICSINKKISSYSLKPEQSILTVYKNDYDNLSPLGFISCYNVKSNYFKTIFESLDFEKYNLSIIAASSNKRDYEGCWKNFEEFCDEFDYNNNNNNNLEGVIFEITIKNTGDLINIFLSNYGNNINTKMNLSYHFDFRTILLN